MKNLIKISMVAALLFAVNTNANAQFGKLKKLADKAKDAVTNTENTTISNPVTESKVSGGDYTSSSSSSDNSFMSPIVVENNGSKAAGGLDKYIGMTEADEALVYSYYQPGSSDFRTGGKYDCGKTYGNMIAQRIVDMYRMIKSQGKMDLASCTSIMVSPKELLLSLVDLI